MDAQELKAAVQKIDFAIKHCTDIARRRSLIIARNNLIRKNQANVSK